MNVVQAVQFERKDSLLIAQRELCSREGNGESKIQIHRPIFPAERTRRHSRKPLPPEARSPY
jgi:hypothetical protein